MALAAACLIVPAVRAAMSASQAVVADSLVVALILFCAQDVAADSSAVALILFCAQTVAADSSAVALILFCAQAVAADSSAVALILFGVQAVAAGRSAVAQILFGVQAVFSGELRIVFVTRKAAAALAAFADLVVFARILVQLPTMWQVLSKLKALTAFSASGRGHATDSSICPSEAFPSLNFFASPGIITLNR